MMFTFRSFIEQEMSALPSAPPNPETKHDSAVGDREMDISPEERDAADLGNFLTSYQPMEFPGHGIKASAPIMLQILRKYPDGSAEVKVMYTLANRQKLQNPNGSAYEGPIEDKSAFLSKQEIEQIRLKPFEQPAGGIGPPPGGPPGMGGMGL